MAAQPVPKIMKQGTWTPWLYLAPALVIMLIFIIYPMIKTVQLSFLDSNGLASAATTCVPGKACWGIFENYHYALTSELDMSSFAALWQSFWMSSYGNTIKWIVLMVGGSTGVGLAFAMLVDRIRYEAVAKAVIFMPMAISFVGAGVIWKFVYDYGTQHVQIGLLNAVLTSLGFAPIAFISTPGLNTVALIVVGIWIWTGFCMTILSASIKSVPAEIVEAAHVDGATGWSTFWRVIVPIIMPTIVVVVTTMVINTLKVFDIVYVMSGGQFGTDVIAVRMYREMYIFYNAGHGTALAVVLVLLVIPFIYINIKRFIEQEAIR
jgi:alpha-glucoside transport system permease protein